MRSSGSQPIVSFPVPNGVMIDGAVYALDGQPPRAVQGSWGDMGWLQSPWRLRLGVQAIGLIPKVGS